jgi:hypothetical protein
MAKSFTDRMVGLPLVATSFCSKPMADYSITRRAR